MPHRLIHGDCIDFLSKTKQRFTCIFADPPDNLGLKYKDYNDELPEEVYLSMLDEFVYLAIHHAKIVWISFNAKWSLGMWETLHHLQQHSPGLEIKPCVQTFTFGRQQQRDLANCHRPLVRLKWKSAKLYPDQIRIPSWRQKNGDKRADPRGKVPGDVFAFPRVTGNSAQRRSWCPTQLNEGLVERCLLLSTKHGDSVLDPFAGSGTTLRVCEQIGRQCTLVEISQKFCKHIAREHGLEIEEFML